jgi:hypothetical protein
MYHNILKHRTRLWTYYIINIQINFSEDSKQDSAGEESLFLNHLNAEIGYLVQKHYCFVFLLKYVCCQLNGTSPDILRKYKLNYSWFQLFNNINNKLLWKNSNKINQFFVYKFSI